MSINFKFLEIPETTSTGRRIHPVERKRIKAARDRMVHDSYDVGGVFFWRANHRPIPKMVFRENYVELTDAQAAADDAETAKVIAQIRANDAPPSAEELFEMRAAFGPGASVVNVITGRKTQL